MNYWHTKVAYFKTSGKPGIHGLPKIRPHTTSASPSPKKNFYWSLEELPQLQTPPYNMDPVNMRLPCIISPDVAVLCTV